MARVNPDLMTAFREKAGITRQAIEARRDRLRRLVPMPSDMATYVAAHRAGVDISKHLDEQTVRLVGEYDERVYVKEGRGAAAAMVAPASGPRRAARARSKRGGPRSIYPNLTVHEGALSEAQLNNAFRMAEVYPLLYAFENSVREFVDGHLAAAYGKNWWDREKLVARPIRDVVRRNQRAKGSERWVLRPNVHPIYMTELGHLADIITSEDGWKVFKKLLIRQSWVQEHVRAFEQPRNVVAHMNPLAVSNIRGLEIRAREWFDQIKGHTPPR